MSLMRSWLRDNSLSIIFFSLFFLSLAVQSFSGLNLQPSISGRKARRSRSPCKAKTTKPEKPINKIGAAQLDQLQ